MKYRRRHTSPESGSGIRALVGRALGAVCEFQLWVLIIASPWAFGCADPLFEFYLFTGLSSLLVLWALRLCIEGRPTGNIGLAGICVAGIILLGLFQSIPLSTELIEKLTPNTARLYSKLLPEVMESVPESALSEDAQRRAGSTISLYPGVTRQNIVRLLAVLALYCFCLSNFTDANSLRRLGVVAVLNGAALSFYALAQFLSEPTLVYWTFNVPGRSFGPFVCRNHFPFYVNMCIGLGVGLLLSVRYETPIHERNRSETKRRIRYDPSTGSIQKQEGFLQDWLAVPLQVLQQPAALWVVAALGLMIGAIFMSMSRGGMLALVGGAVVAAVFHCGISARSSRWALILLTTVVAISFLGWLGLEAVGDRLETLWEGEAFEQSRLPLWQRLPSLIKDFPIWGTGLGAFRYIEPLYRVIPDTRPIYNQHAHNEYLEALVEGGVIRLGFALLGCLSIFWAGGMAIRRYRGRSAAGMVTGAVLAFSTFVIHSIGDFGAHIPAIVILAVVVAAHLAGRRRDNGPAPHHGPWRLSGLVGAVLVLSVSLTLFLEAWKWERTDSLRDTAQRSFPSSRERIDLLSAAVRHSPHYAGLRLELGRELLRRFDQRSQSVARRSRDRFLFQLLNVAGAQAIPGGVLGPARALIIYDTVSQVPLRYRQEMLVRELLNPGLAHLLKSRTLCPLLPATHLELASRRSSLVDGQRREAYLASAKLLAPTDTSIWYSAGLQELLDGNESEAWNSWRRSLSLSKRHIEPIIRAGSQLLDTEQMLNKLLPPFPDIISHTAWRLYPRPQQHQQRQPFIKRAWEAMERHDGPLTPEDYHLLGSLRWGVGRLKEASQAYNLALVHRPDKENWRFEYARLLQSLGRTEEALKQTRLILQRSPRHGGAKTLLDQLEKSSK